MKTQTKPTTYVSFKKACQIIKTGGVVAIPTETVYGLAGSVFNESALKKIFQIKKRPLFNPLIIHCAHEKDMRQFHNVSEPLLSKMIQHFCPGPLTFVLLKNKKVNPMITAGQTKAAFRIPRHPLTLKLIEQVGALCAPSANLFTQLSPTRPEHIYLAFKNQVPILQGGQCEGGIESTVIEPDFEKHCLNILRPGLVSKEHLTSWLKKEKLKNWKVMVTKSTFSPGQKQKHYQPTVPLVLIEYTSSTPPTEQDVESRLYGFGLFGIFKPLRLKESPVLSARMLYHELSLLSKNPSHIIYVIKPAKDTRWAWQAIWDRLNKAASHRLSWYQAP